MITGDKAMGMVEAIGEVFPKAKYQCCTVHFYRNVFSVVPNGKVQIVAKMLKAIHAQEDKLSALQKAAMVVEKLNSMSAHSPSRTGVVLRILDGECSARC